MERELATEYNNAGSVGKLGLIARLTVFGHPRFQREFANAYDDTGTFGTLGLVERLDLLQKSLSIREMLVTLDPDDPIAHRELGDILDNIGGVLQGMGQPGPAWRVWTGRRAARDHLSQSTHDWLTGQSFR